MLENFCNSKINEKQRHTPNSVILKFVLFLYLNRVPVFDVVGGGGGSSGYSDDAVVERDCRDVGLLRRNWTF